MIKSKINSHTMKCFSLLLLCALLTSAYSKNALAEQGNTQTIQSLKAETIVMVSGTVERIRDEDEFILSDKTGSIKIYIGPNIMPVKVGDAVTVKGMYDNDIVKREIYAHEITDKDGKVTKLGRRYE